MAETGGAKGAKKGLTTRGAEKKEAFFGRVEKKIQVFSFARPDNVPDGLRGKFRFPRWSIGARSMARSTRSGTLVGPGICRKCRPRLTVIGFPWCGAVACGAPMGRIAARIMSARRRRRKPNADPGHCDIVAHGPHP